ncbi:peptidoglycan-binding protein [Streptomyces sp. NPDC051684]|uniref:peptidoglycan-binding protein n=1 Tax=Streptomyces sp. NPDC051684 TaxID=3365670 RepID=UPI0037B554D5
MTVLYYPGASRAYDYSDRYKGDTIKPNCGVIHTTEGTSLPSYGQGAEAPNITAKPNFAKKRLDYYQHYAFNRSARALVNTAGGVETNTLNCIQIELVGTCDPKRKKSWNGAKAGEEYLYWPDAPRWALDSLAEFMAWQHKNNGIPLSGPSKWLAYPASYGTSGGARLSFKAWNEFNGWCGHSHVPENVHGDPGDLDFAELLKLAKGKSGTVTSPSDSSSSSSSASKPAPPFPGTQFFGPGKSNAHILALGKRLVKKGFGSHYKVGPSKDWGEADRQNVASFQRAHKQLSGDADGYPGPLTWKLLFS